MKLPSAALWLCLFIVPPLFAQGSLTPSGAPAPTMKTLAQVEPRTPISAAPYTITNSGSYYLTAVLTGIAATNGITIQANDVTIDLNGFSLVGVPGSLSGIAVTGSRTNISIIKGVIRNWGAAGVRVDGRSVQCRDLMVSSNAADGLDLAGVVYVTVKECHVLNNRSRGIEVGGDGVIENCQVSQNGATGIQCSGTTVIHCRADSNGAAGIYAYSASKVIGCTSGNNAQDGIVLGRYSQALESACVENNSSGNLSYAGIRTFYDGGRIEGNHVRYLSSFGILIGPGLGDPGTNWVVIRNSTVGATANAISAPLDNDIGPIGSAATATSPWANLRN
jgi:hypothetical protein